MATDVIGPPASKM